MKKRINNYDYSDPDFLKAFTYLCDKFPGANLDDPTLVKFVQESNNKYELKIKFIKYIGLFLIAPLFVFGLQFFITKLLNNSTELSIIFDIHYFIRTILVSFFPSILLWYVIRD